MSSHQNSRRVALITGSAGQLGQKISEHLSSAGSQTIGIYRQQLPKAINNFLPLCADLMGAESLNSALKSTDTVIHLAWQGGVLGSANFNGFKPSDAQIQLSNNVLMTQNVIRSMERSNAKRIVFLSWVGVKRNAENTMLREKYWAENVILNSRIPIKIIIRAGAVGTGIQDSELIRAAAALAKIPLFLPVPKQVEGVVLTTLSDILGAIDTAMQERIEGAGCKIIDLTSTAPLNGASLMNAFEHKVWGKKRLCLGGVLGDLLFRWAESKFGTAKPHEPRLTDFFTVSKINRVPPVSGVPPIAFGVDGGRKIEAVYAL